MKLEKLELKHLKGYLGTELKVFRLAEIGNPQTVTLTTNVLSLWEDNYYDEFKPVIRQLPDLKKDEYFDLYMDLCEEMETISCEYLLEALINKTKYSLDIKKFEALENWMYKNHFDWKYDLIKNGLAIDINTLEK